MLPPQLRSSTAASRFRVTSNNALRAASTAVLRAPTTRGQLRSFWRGRRRLRDWTSHLDPMYQHFSKFHTFKARAKLLKNIRRRQTFEWDVKTRPFFVPSHLRWASHWRGRQWYTNDDPKQKIREDAAAEEQQRKDEDGYELSKREKEWKDQMEAMRKRIAQDPYEAIFGKRFEPFWSPLVPSWMREEMGLQGWPKEKIKEVEKTVASARQGTDSSETTKAILNELRDSIQNAPTRPVAPETAKQTRSEAPAKPRNTTTTSPQDATNPPKPFSRMTREERIRHVLHNAVMEHASKSPASQTASAPESYAYASSTSWDSMSNKTRKVEWDSASKQTKKFEYDPISNRMVEIEAPSRTAIDSDSSAVRQSVGDARQGSSKATSDSLKAVDIPIKQSNEIRKSIPIPPPLSQPSHSITLGYTQTSIGPLRDSAMTSASNKPAALAKLPAQDLDMLTADRVRASMGKVKQVNPGAKGTTAEEKAKLEHDFDKNARAQDAEVDAILKERTAVNGRMDVPSAWDQAELADIYEREVDNLQKRKEKLMDDEKGLFHIERQKREIQKLDERIRAVTTRVEAMNLAVMESPKVSTLQTSLQRAEAKKDSPLLQSSIERMQSRDLPKAQEQDLDDAAAHESTEAIGTKPGVPKEWNKAADLLQADRVKRTASKRPYPMTRWIDDMNARKVAYEQRKAELKAAEDAKNAESNAKLEKINKMLEAEVAEQKFKMQAFEGRYVQKVKSLRGELDRTFKQSSVHSEKHVERIRELEAELSALKNKDSKYADKVKSLREELDRTFKQSSVLSEKHVDRIRELEAELTGSKNKESKYTDKVKSLRDELERAYKQSAVHAEKHLERIKYLESELERAAKSPLQEKKPEAPIPQAEGDLCVNAPSFVGNGKWYKKPAHPPQPSREEVEAAEGRARDKALADEVRGIYEDHYGVIDENHEQPKSEDENVAAYEEHSFDEEKPISRSRLAKLKKKEAKAERKALKKAAKEAREEANEGQKGRQVVEVESDVDLGEELAKYEEQNPGAYRFEESLASPESAEKMKSVIADSLERDMAAPKAGTKAMPRSMEWADPPLYKVLAYDSGNDMMSTATTKTSVLPGSAEERPLGIPEALGQLYQPARFVPYFAELQSDNFQAIAATREVIVFRQVKAPASAATEASELGKPKVGLEDHGLDALKADLDKTISKGKSRSSNSDVNPIDGTSRRHYEPTTGNFASPTGFVNHDPVFPPEGEPEQQSFNDQDKSALSIPTDLDLEANHAEQASSSLDSQSQQHSDTYSTIAKELTAKTSRQIWESMPGSNETPVKRTESVFSGMTKKQRKRAERELREQREPEAREREQQHANEWRKENARRQGGSSSRSEGQAGGRVLKYMLGAGAGTATVMYLVGALAERERDSKYQSENKMRERARAWKMEQDKKRLESEVERLAREWERR